MKKVLLFLVAILFFAVSAFAASDVTFEWDANSEADLAGYRLYISSASGNYDFGIGSSNLVATISPDAETYTLLGVPDGTWYWVLTAYDTHDNESGPSNEVNADLDTTAPAPPQNFIIALIKKVIAWILNLFSNFRVA